MTIIITQEPIYHAIHSDWSYVHDVRIHYTKIVNFTMFTDSISAVISGFSLICENVLGVTLTAH